MSKRLQARLLDARQKRAVGELVINRDWVQAQALAAIARSSILSDTLVFKGGTALQKVFFGDGYRFSEDLDFTALKTWKPGELRQALDAVCDDVKRHVAENLGENFEIAVGAAANIRPQQEAFKLQFTMPWQEQSVGSIKLEITFDEPILLAAKRRPLLVTYGDVDAEVLSYALEEVVLEKIRAAQQTLANRDRRVADGGGDWIRPRSRDFYDLWRIIESDHPVSWVQVRDKLSEKCRARDVVVSAIEHVFAEEVLDEGEAPVEGAARRLCPGPSARRRRATH